MITVSNGVYAEAARNLVESHPSYDTLCDVLRGPLQGRRAYVWGGIVRDAIINELWSTNRRGKDIDVLVDDSAEPINMDALAQELGAKRSMFGCLRLGDVDIIPFRDKKFARVFTLQAMLASTDLTTVSAALDLQDGVLYDVAAIDSNSRRSVGINCAEDIPQILIKRVVKEAMRLDYTIEPEALDIIQSQFTPEVQHDILAWYARKGVDTGERIVAFLERQHVRARD